MNLTIKELAKLLERPVSAVYRMIKEGKLPHHTSGRVVEFSRRPPKRKQK